MSNEKKEASLVRTDYDMFLYDDGVHKYTQEEVDELNKKLYANHDAQIPLILEDGLIPFPVFFDKGDELIEGVFYVPTTFTPSCTPGFEETFGTNFNFYIPSFGRAGNAPTLDMLDRFNVDNWYVMIDPSQYPAYREVYPYGKIIIRDPKFRTLDRLHMGTSLKSPDNFHGTAGVYNSLLYFSRSMGETHYWTIDDDMIGMAMKARKGNVSAPLGEKYDKMNYYRCSNILEEYGFNYKEFISSVEELTRKMRNPGFVGFEKFGLVFALPVMWKQGTRVYSFYLSSNATQVDHLGQHNNDVVTSLELSKHGMVNMLFEGISYNSKATQAGGGLTDLYQKFGTLDKGKVLVRTQPNYAKINYNYSRIHHVVDYTKTNAIRLVGAVKEQ